MKNFLSLLLVLLVFTSVSAQDKDPKVILDKVSAKTKSYSTISADFTYTLDNLQEEISETSKGSISLKGDKYKLNLMGSEIYSDEQTMWSHIIDAEEVNINEPDEDDEDALNPSKLFTVYEDGFKFKFIREKFEKGHALYEIDLYPIDLEKSYSRIKLKIDKDKMHIFSAKYFGKDGNHYTIEVLKFTPNAPMADSMFIFNEKDHPDVEVIDMR